MIGKSLKDPNTLKGAMESLSNEINPNAPAVSASPSYRKSLALGLFYKVHDSPFFFINYYINVFSFTLKLLVFLMLIHSISQQLCLMYVQYLKLPSHIVLTPASILLINLYLN